jgi:hypothetical protein
MVSYILSLKENEGSRQLPPKGSFSPTVKNQNDILLLTASYKDKGAPGIESIDERRTIRLVYPKFPAQSADKAWEAFAKNNYGKSPFFMRLYKPNAYLSFDDIDLSGVSHLQVNALANGDIPLFVEIRQDSIQGKLIGRKQIDKANSPLDFKANLIPIAKAGNGRRPLFISLAGEGLPVKGSDLAIEWIYFSNGKSNLLP